MNINDKKYKEKRFFHVVLFPFLIFNFLLIIFNLNAFPSDYKEIIKEYKNYDAPEFYKHSISPSQSSLSGDKKNSSESNTLAIEEQSENQKQMWKTIIRIPNDMVFLDDEVFFDVNSEKSKKIRAIAETDQIYEILKQGIEPDTLISVALERNPGLKSAKKIWSSTLEKYPQASRLDNILRQYQSFVKDLNTKVGPMRHKSSVSKKFPFPGTLTLKGDIVTKEVEIAREAYIVTLRNLITGIKNSYDELLYTDYTIQIIEDNLELLEQLEKVAYVKYKTGKAGFSDVIKVQTKIVKLKDDLITRQEYRETVIVKLNTFMNIPPGFQPGNLKNVPLRATNLPFQKLVDIGIEHQQELKIIRLKIEKINLAIELGEKKFYPDYTLGYSVTPFSLKPANMTNFWFGKNDAYVREVRLKYQSLIKKLESQEDKLKFQIKKILFQLNTAKRDVKLYEDSLLPLAQKDLEVARIDYQAGRSDFLDVLYAQETWLNYRLHYQRYVRDQNQGITNLEKIIGKRIENIENEK